MDGGFLPETAATRAAEFRRGPDAWATDPLPPSAALLAVAEAGPEVPPDSGCSRCTSLSYNQEYYKAFGVLLCNSCKRDEKLVSKTAVRQCYCLTEGDLRKLGNIRRANSHNRNWQPTCLYLESQVRAVCRTKFGSEGDMQERQRQLLDSKLEARIRRREDDKRRGEQEGERLRRIKQRIEEEHGGTGDGVALGGGPAEQGRAAGEDVEEI